MDKEKKLGQEPAFAYKIELANGEVKESIGMSKRFYAACAAMNGLIANPTHDYVNEACLIQQSYLFADELLRQENL